MNRCISCGSVLSPLNGVEENDFAVECGCVDALYEEEEFPPWCQDRDEGDR